MKRVRYALTALLLAASLRIFHVVMIAALSTFILTGNSPVHAQGQSPVATVYDPVAQFSETTNSETSTWSYRSGTTRDGNYDLFPEFNPSTGVWTPDIGIWALDTGGFQIPAVGVNTTGGPANFLFFGETFVWPNNTIWMHPGSPATPTNPDLVVVSWLSPTTSQVDIVFQFTDMHVKTGGPNVGQEDGIAWAVDRGAVELRSGMFDVGGTSGPISVFTLVTAGERINFIVMPKDFNAFDSTEFTATIRVLRPTTPPGPPS